MRVGEYQVLQRLGAGGFGDVYMCQSAATGYLLAIKLGTSEVDPDEALDRDSLQPDEWRAYRALDFGRSAAAEHGVPAVYETGGAGGGGGLSSRLSATERRAVGDDDRPVMMIYQHCCHAGLIGSRSTGYRQYMVRLLLGPARVQR
jgi:hypothetical protein